MSTQSISLTGQQSEYQYKKTLGVAYEYPGSQPSQETVSSLPYIINSQIMTNNIPIPAPLLSPVPQSLIPGTKYSTTNPNIYYYYLYPLAVSIQSANYAYVFSATQSANVTTHSIPSTYDPAGSYGISVSYLSQGVYNQVASSSTSMSWIFDNATGVLTFTTQKWTNVYTGYPYITFWRYEGTFGIPWDTSGNNIYNNNNLGNVGINNTSPQYTLDVSGNLNFTGNLYQNNNLFNPGVSYWTLSSNNIYNNNNSGNGYVGIGTSTPQYTLDVSGNIHSNATTTCAQFNATSDYRIKENVVELDETYTIDNLRPVKYTNKLTGKEDLGLIAHELQEIYPFLVNGKKDDETQKQSINYQGLIAVLINEIKELKNILRKNNLC